LFVVGQKVEEEFIVNGNSVGVQAVEPKVFLKNRNEVLMSSQSLSKRIKSTKITSSKMHN
jgi:hypothetical protein